MRFAYFVSPHGNQSVKIINKLKCNNYTPNKSAKKILDEKSDTTVPVNSQS